MLIDTHCHIHDSEFFTPEAAQAAYERARADDVVMCCVGTTAADSRQAAKFVENRDGAWFIAGVHPHEATGDVDDIGVLLREKPAKLVGIGEIGLDYFYNHSPRDVQIRALEQQLQWAMEYDLPVSFHVREAFDDFWPVFDNFQSIRGVLHSFTDTNATMERGLARGLYIAVNGISTFTRDESQQKMFQSIPLERLVVETDAPFLTPKPFRGKVNEPGKVSEVVKFHAAQRSISFDELSRQTTANAQALFGL